MKEFILLLKVALITILGLCPTLLFANQLYTNVGDNSGYSNTQTSTTASSLSDNISDPHSLGTVTAAYGSAHTDLTIAIGANTGGYSVMGVIGQWTTTLTINNPALTGQGGTARFNVHLLGSMTGTFGTGAYGAVNYQVSGGSSYTPMFNYSGGVSQDGTNGTPYGSLQSFTGDTGFYYGTPFDVQITLNTSGSGGDSQVGGMSVAGHFTASAGSFVVLDGQGHPVDYTATTSGGTARSSNIASGNSYNGFTLTNTTDFGRIGSTLSLLDGVASANTAVSAAFTSPPPASQTQLVSDAVDLTGTGSDPVVIQMNYDPALAQSLFGREAGLLLGWLNLTTGTWMNAIAGNGGGTPRFFARGYNGATDFHLGYYGVDTANNVVWAVVNHNSEFAVTDVTTILPVPSVTLLSNGHIFVKLSGQPNAQNRVEGSPDLSPNSWSTLATQTSGPTGVVSYEDSNPGTRRFYRVVSP